ncbi:hypothetical protein DE146DRAFT_607045 [Phaeosphaeria sp. MPI-PUGE-AT-0046c]|nr:hypothetical protein DE146DRAFT_607045 [Phaeosphaeria sp. MPI-PUGE-AT-0046c]
MAQRIVLVTGANRKGIGLAIVHRLAKNAPSNIYLLGVRSTKAGEGAVQQLRDMGVTATLELLELDVTHDDQVQSAVTKLQTTFGRLDVLINNAGIATVPTQDSSFKDLRVTYNNILNTNVTSVATLTTAFVPLLRRSADPRVINISSGRASIHALTKGSLPPTVSVPYSVSKLAMNVLMLEMSKSEEHVLPSAGSKILYQAVNPGHCKTALNGFRGSRDPYEGVRVVQEMVLCERDTFETGFWVWEGDEENGELKRVPW